MKRSLDDNAVAVKCIESICDDLSAIKKNSPMLREAYVRRSLLLRARFKLGRE